VVGQTERGISLTDHVRLLIILFPGAGQIVGLGNRNERLELKESNGHLGRLYL
jgi:hypothetical protein